jgi:hypothetical protein
MPKSPETALTCQESAWALLGHLLARQGRNAAGDLRNIPRYVIHALFGMAVVVGLLSLWGLHGDGKTPSMSPLCGLDPYRISSAHCIADETTAEARWNGLAPAMAILDQVNPTIATWVREKHDNGLILFGDKRRTNGDPGEALAKYDMFRGRLVVNRELFCENDGTIAVILCHEYRHSRQNLGKFGQYVLSFLFVTGGDLSIIENDAVIYEHEAHNAVFGNGTSREKEIAAWEASIQLQNQTAQHGRTPPTSSPVVANAHRSP